MSFSDGPEDDAAVAGVRCWLKKQKHPDREVRVFLFWRGRVPLGRRETGENWAAFWVTGRLWKSAKAADEIAFSYPPISQIGRIDEELT